MCKAHNCTAEIKPKGFISVNISVNRLHFLLKKLQNNLPRKGWNLISYSPRLKKTQPMYLHLLHSTFHSTSPSTGSLGIPPPVWAGTWRSEFPNNFSCEIKGFIYNKVFLSLRIISQIFYIYCEVQFWCLNTDIWETSEHKNKLSCTWSLTAQQKEEAVIPDGFRKTLIYKWIPL